MKNNSVIQRLDELTDENDEFAKNLVRSHKEHQSLTKKQWDWVYRIINANERKILAKHWRRLC